MSRASIAEPCWDKNSNCKLNAEAPCPGRRGLCKRGACVSCLEHCAFCDIPTLCEQRVPLEEHNCLFLPNQAWERKMNDNQRMQADATALHEQIKNAELIHMHEA